MFNFMFNYGIRYLFFIGLTLIILDFKYRRKSSSNFSENKNKKGKLKKNYRFFDNIFYNYSYLCSN